jgi:TATA-box binding protein (TBP) (component of TFIID and TFIIIB)
MSLDDEWNSFLNNNFINSKNDKENEKIIADTNKIIPKASEIYISTKTKIVYLTIKKLDIYNLFWNINIINYNSQNEGIIKKQVKLSLNSEQESIDIDEKIKDINEYIKIKVINKLENISNRSKYKDIRKISIGLSKKDLLISRSKEKSAFYNCFVLTVRLKENTSYKEYHVKIFNTGKIEIPGIQKEESLHKIILFITNILSNILNKKIDYEKDTIENVLVNSNFDCGFYINREILFNILRNKYFINAAYDPCSYPGIQCNYYYNKNTNQHIQNIELENIKDKSLIVKVSYMIFRTGSILIVGKCDDNILKNVYEYIKSILYDTYDEIAVNNSNKAIIKENKILKKNNKKKIILIK